MYILDNKHMFDHKVIPIPCMTKVTVHFCIILLELYSSILTLVQLYWRCWIMLSFNEYQIMLFTHVQYMYRVIQKHVHVPEKNISISETK